MKFNPKPCATCGDDFIPTGSRARFCDKHTGMAAMPAPEAVAPTEQPDALEVIDTFALDFNVGNAVRFLLEKDDGDEATNLQSAITYIERAIARIERAA